MRNISTAIITPAIISLVLVLPFISLEWINRRNLPGDFPVVLFGLLWLLAVIFILLLMPIVRDVRVGAKIKLSPINLLRVVFLILIAWF